MAFNFQPGNITGIRWQALGQGQVSTLTAISNKAVDFLVALADVSGTGMPQQGRTGRLPTKYDTAVSFTLHFDADNPPYLNPPLIRPGVRGILLYYLADLGLSRPVQIPMVVEKVHAEDSTETEVKWSTDLKEEAYSGLFVWPSA